MSKEEAAPRQKKGFMSRLRSKRSSKKASTKVATKTVDDKRQDTRTPPPTVEVPQKRESVTREGVPVVSAQNPDDFVPSDVRQTVPGRPVQKSMNKTYRATHKPERIVLAAPPSAREAAFSGPPRYDWIDIETAAAVKVQAAYRRNKVMWELEKEGVSTQAMRNRARRREARQRLAASEDAPDLLRCCGVGLLFGDATEEDEAAARAREKELYLEKKRAKAEREEKLRRTYRKKAESSDEIMECLEVEEDFGQEAMESVKDPLGEEEA